MSVEKDYKVLYEELLRIMMLHPASLFTWALVDRYLHDTRKHLSYINSSLYNLQSKLRIQNNNAWYPFFDRIEKALDDFSSMNEQISREFTMRRTSEVPEKIYLKQAIYESVELYDRISRHQIDFHIKEIPDDLSFTGYKYGFNAAFRNILDNAFDAMAEIQDPEIIISVGEIFEEEIDSLFINIADNSVGIPEVSIPLVFEPFFSTKTNGTGLNLSIAKLFVEDILNGKIKLFSGNGHGLTVTIIIPRS